MYDVLIRTAAETPNALTCLYSEYYSGLCKEKQAFLSNHLPAHWRQLPGLTCFQNGEVVAGLLWQNGRDNEFARVIFYCESPEATRESVNELVGAYLSENGYTPRHYLEIWANPEAQIHSALQEHGFKAHDRQLLRFSEPVPLVPMALDIELMPLSEFDPRRDDVIAIAELLQRAYEGSADERLLPGLRDKQNLTDYVAGFLDSPGCSLAHSFVAWSTFDGEPAGIAMSYWSGKGRSLYLEQLAVSPTHRRLGIGRALLTAVISAIQPGSLSQVLLTVTEANRRALRLYKELGATLVSREKAYALEAHERFVSRRLRDLSTTEPLTQVPPGQ